MKNIGFFYRKIFLFLVENFSTYLNRRVFVMKGKKILIVSYGINLANKPLSGNKQPIYTYCAK